jgi:hypothetical protein
MKSVKSVSLLHKTLIILQQGYVSIASLGIYLWDVVERLTAVKATP